MKKSAPLRTCVACRRQSDKGDLLRVVRAADGSICVDSSGNKPGRGAYVCSSRQCVCAVKSGGKLEKALRCRVPVEIYVELEESLKDEETQ